MFHRGTKSKWAGGLKFIVRSREASECGRGERNTGSGESPCKTLVSGGKHWKMNY